MSDVVVTVPKRLWREWLAEGDVAFAGAEITDGGAPWEGDQEYGFVVSRNPNILHGERVYIVAHGKLRGYAPLIRIGAGQRFGGGPRSRALIRRGDAVAVTIPEPIPGFRGFRYRWWDREIEIAFPAWRTDGC